MKKRGTAALLSALSVLFVTTTVYAQNAPRPIPVPSPFQVWADANKDGLLDAHEVDEITAAALDLFSGAHGVRTPMDMVFDVNRDGSIDFSELRIAQQLLKDQLPAMASMDPAFRARLDFNDDGIIDDVEKRTVVDYLFNDPLARDPHPSESPIDMRVDMNRDGQVSAEEIFDYRVSIARFAILSAPPPNVEALAAEVQVMPVWEAPATGLIAHEEPTAVRATRQEPATGTDIALTAGIDEVFPVFHKYYDDHPIGKATLKNNGTATMENIQVTLTVKGYMTEKKPCKAPEKLAPGEAGEVDLYALFTKDVLDISEPTKALANISVDYTVGGKSQTKEFVETISFLNRNNMTWDDDNRVAAFVTANDKAVMMFRSAAVAVIDQASSAVDAKLRTAMAIHGALSLYGMKYWSDPKSSFETRSKSKTEVDYLQFPEQTLQLKTGDCDDLAILYAALLEASSVNTAFITVPGHIFVAFELEDTPEAAKARYLKWEDLILTADGAWVPVEVTSVKEGFLKAWETGAKEWRDARGKSQAAMLTFEDARKKYAPVGFSASAPSLTLPAESALAAAYKAEVKKFIDREIATPVAALTAEIKKTGGKPESVNKLGVLYARYGLLDDAMRQFASIVKTTEYVPALVNLGNIEFLNGDAKKALEYYERAQKREPDKATALLGIARANHELENYGKVQEAFARLKAVDAKLASSYTYLDLRGTEATKAADMSDATGKVEWAEK